MEFRTVVLVQVNADTAQNAARKAMGLIKQPESPVRCIGVENLKTGKAELVDVQEGLCHI